ncbi:hypothetical protein N7471_009776 [Penicillium samsonianum]|uniref:uncharacterized protein n=1 Tax=Penicillium samsonianum TaxID=1882272 RepID=UPI0025487EE4|nr:uncharacterized protein N7471_009776 [Penicillium samsonianum]KAJ6128559.1 hypothetical protein N7471_009776 [Penicillium samsonianum]
MTPIQNKIVTSGANNFLSTLLGWHLATGSTDMSVPIAFLDWVNWNEINCESLQSRCLRRNALIYLPKRDQLALLHTLPVCSRFSARILPRDRPASLPHSL